VSTFFLKLVDFIALVILFFSMFVSDFEKFTYVLYSHIS
jgi:hypothetical protein